MQFRLTPLRPALRRILPWHLVPIASGAPLSLLAVVPKTHASVTPARPRSRSQRCAAVLGISLLAEVAGATCGSTARLNPAPTLGVAARAARFSSNQGDGAVVTSRRQHFVAGNMTLTWYPAPVFAQSAPSAGTAAGTAVKKAAETADQPAKIPAGNTVEGIAGEASARAATAKETHNAGVVAAGQMPTQPSGGLSVRALRERLHCLLRRARRHRDAQLRAQRLLRQRVRKSAWAPEMRLRGRIGRGNDLATFLRSDGDRWNHSTVQNQWVEGGLLFRFDRLVFHPAEFKVDQARRALIDRWTQTRDRLIALHHESVRLQREIALIGENVVTRTRIEEIEAQLQALAVGRCASLLMPAPPGQSAKSDGHEVR